MSDVVRDAFLEFTGPLEGAGVPCLYNDVRGITTIAWGNAVFSAAEAVALPLMHPGGVPATAAEKVAAYQAVNSNRIADVQGWTYAAKLTTLRLTRDGMAAMAMRKFDANETALMRRCATWGVMPACARLAIHSLAWACGAGAHFPRLFSALDVHDYEHAAVEIHMNEWTKSPSGATIKNAGLVPRNVANKILMRNAAKVEAYHLDPDYINWKADLQSSTMPPPMAETYDHTSPTYTENAASLPTEYPKAGSNRGCKDE